MANGFRVPPQATKNEQLRQIDVELKNQAMANQISQMMVKQLMQSVKSMSDDLGFALNQLNDLQYKNTALIKHFNVSTETLDKLANEQRLLDFNEAAEKADAKESLVVADVASGESTVTITSTAKDESGNDRGIFRSRIKLVESGSPDLIAALTGKKAGDKVQVKLNGVDHEVELLAIRNSSLVAATTETVQ